MDNIVTIIINGQKLEMYLDKGYDEAFELCQNIYAGALECGQTDFVITIRPAGGGEDA